MFIELKNYIQLKIESSCQNSYLATYRRILASTGIFGCNILLARYIDDSISGNDTYNAEGSVLVVSSKIFLRLDCECFATFLHLFFNS